MLRLLGRATRGPVADRWSRLVKEGTLVGDTAQARAVSIVDTFYHTVRGHRSSAEHIPLEPFDLSLFRPTTARKETTGDVESYTKRLALENARLVQKQRGGEPMAVDYISQERSAVVAPRLADTVSAPSPPVPETRAQRVTESTTPTGLYLFGSVGRGKTMLMDVVYDELRKSNQHASRVLRLHFFDFMKRVHASMREKDLVSIANSIADDTDVLCLDEVAIADIQDATIFPSILGILLKRKVVLVMTSNQHPQSLYSGGLNRHIYLPPILKELRAGCTLVSLDEEASVDYRTLASGARGWRWLQHSDVVPDGDVVIPLSPSRNITLPRSDDVVVTDMDSLVSADLSDADYVSIAEYLRSHNMSLRLLIDRSFKAVDILSSARRFGKLVEVLYDQRCPLEIVSRLSIGEIFADVIVPVDSLTASGAVGDTADALASPLASSAVSEGLVSITRCMSRLRECTPS